MVNKVTTVQLPETIMVSCLSWCLFLVNVIHKFTSFRKQVMEDMVYAVKDALEQCALNRLCRDKPAALKTDTAQDKNMHCMLNDT